MGKFLKARSTILASLTLLFLLFTGSNQANATIDRVRTDPGWNQESSTNPIFENPVHQPVCVMENFQKQTPVIETPNPSEGKSVPAVCVILMPSVTDMYFLPPESPPVISLKNTKQFSKGQVKKYHESNQSRFYGG